MAAIWASKALIGRPRFPPAGGDGGVGLRRQVVERQDAAGEVLCQHAGDGGLQRASSGAVRQKGHA
jgi:hypothetical protein